MKQWEVTLLYIGKPPMTQRVYGNSRGNALRIACMNAEAKGWPKFANSHKIVEI